MTAKTDADLHSEQVRRYYDSNTSHFERRGQRTSIHRAVWGPGVKTREAAFHYVDDLILDALRTVGDVPKVVDLGCGTGASLIYLASHIALVGEGITNSPRQADRARELIKAARPTGQVRCREGNYLALPADLANAHLAFSIEAFVHSPDAAGYFREAARVLRPGGKLIVCDDFLAARETRLTSSQERWLEEFRRGWRVGSLVTVGRARALGEAAGLKLVQDLDLTPYLELRRLRDRWVSVLVAAIRYLRLRDDYWNAMLGGNALQHALGAGVLQYRSLKFEAPLI